MAPWSKSMEEKRIERGREHLQTRAPHVDEAWEFYRGNHFAYVDYDGKLQVLPTRTSVRGKGRPRHRSRKSYNIIFDVVLQEVSAAVSRVPSYQVTPSTRDPEDVSAAKLAEKIALYGWYQWHLRAATRDAIMHAIIGGEAFAWAYFDNTIGPFIADDKGSVGLGDVRVKVYGGNECFWEPGLRFYDSPWHAVEHARPVDAVMSMDGYSGPKKLTPDANTRGLSNRGQGKSSKPNLVLVTEYLERPTGNNPQGKWITYANNSPISKARPYPGDGADPCIRKLSYAPDPDNDRDLGLVPQVIDPMRTKNDSENKATEWKNLLLNPRIVVSPGLFKKQRWTDEPNKVYEIPDPERNFKVVDTPQIPRELFDMADRAVADIDRIAAAGVRDASQFESGKEAQVYDARATGRKQDFFADLADFHGRVMHDCLVQVQQSYTEPRTLQIRGRFGADPVKDFKGAKLNSQVDVRVSPDSIEPRTKQAVEQRVMNYATLGWITPEQAMAAINAGTAEGLIDSYELAYGRVNSIIQKIRDGSFLEAGSRPVLPNEEHWVPAPPEPQIDPVTGEPAVDPLTGEPLMNEEPLDPMTGQPQMIRATTVPEWMPRPFDKLRVHKQQMEDWMSTTDWDDLPDWGKEAAHTYYQAILDLEAKEAERAAMLQADQAADLGMANASRPSPPTAPSLPRLDGQPASPADPS